MQNKKRKVVFPKHYLVAIKSTPAAGGTRAVSSSSSPSSPLPQTMEDESTSSITQFLIQPPLLRDVLLSPSSQLQDATISECLPLLNGLNDHLGNPFDYDERGVKQLDRESHIDFAENALAPFPAPFVTIDASRPWMIYWALTSLYFLGEDVKSYRYEIVKTFHPLQNKTGGYGGGQGHLSHLAGTYATILSLALVGGEEAYGLTDRHAMWSWLGRLKQRDGGFQICEGGEEDTRAAYCALLIIALLDLPWQLPSDSPARSMGFETFGDGLGEYISRCQTYEGGISSEPGTEAHGAYTFCALAALCLLDLPHVSVPKYLNVDQFISWLTSRQYAPEGGLAGRTNKVVDGCYSHWLGSCFPLLQAALTGPVESSGDNDVGDLYSTDGLGRYILNCCQSPTGGLRDKPSKGPDIYHTCYTLAGLSVGEHYHYYAHTPTSSNHNGVAGGERFEWVFRWDSVWKLQRKRDQDTYQAKRHMQPAFEPGILLGRLSHSNCGLNAVHPVFVIPHQAVLSMREWSVGQPAVA